MKSQNELSIRSIKETAHRRILDILEHVAGIPAAYLDEKHHPCPKCDGKDRFRLINADAGAVFCNRCFNENNGDFIAAVQHYRNVSFSEALRLIANYLGIEAESTALANVTTSKKPTGTWV